VGGKKIWLRRHDKSQFFALRVRKQHPSSFLTALEQRPACPGHTEPLNFWNRCLAAGRLWFEKSSVYQSCATLRIFDFWSSREGRHSNTPKHGNANKDGCKWPTYWLSAKKNGTMANATKRVAATLEQKATTRVTLYFGNSTSHTVQVN